MARLMIPQPGDFCCVPIGGPGGRVIGLGERLCGSAFSMYQHAFVYLGDMTVVEAMPHGARTRRLVAPAEQFGLWSSGSVLLVSSERTAICAAARGYVGVGYSWLDYGAIAAHALHLPIPGLRGYIGSTHHQICSMLVDQCYADAGVHLFDDGRWPGWVTPSDLAGVVEAGLPSSPAR
jgi:hypothetical protein